MRILLATDGSEPAGLAVNLVDSITWPRGSTIEVVAVFRQSRDFTAIPVSTTTPEPPEVVGSVRYEPARWLDDALTSAVGQLDRPGRKVARVMLTGRAGSAIVKEAKGFDPDLVVVGSRGLGGMKRMVLGSVSSEVVDHSARPVLVTRGSQMRSLIFATDGSADSRAAERVLADWPIFKGLPVTVVSVAETEIPVSAGMAPGLYDQVVGSYEGDLSEAAREVAAIAEAAAARLSEAGLVATPMLRGGSPAEQIVAAAEELEADLIVTGTRGHTGLARLVLGSVARNVVHHADCSVLIVRGKKKGRGRRGKK